MLALNYLWLIIDAFSFDIFQTLPLVPRHQTRLLEEQDGTTRWWWWWRHRPRRRRGERGGGGARGLQAHSLHPGALPDRGLPEPSLLQRQPRPRSVALGPATFPSVALQERRFRLVIAILKIENII